MESRVKFIIMKLKQLHGKHKQLREWIQKRPLAVTAGRCIVVVLCISLIAWDAWSRNMEAIIIAIPGVSFWIIPILWEPLHRKGNGGGWDEDDSGGPDDGPDSPTGESADKWLRTRAKTAGKG